MTEYEEIPKKITALQWTGENAQEVADFLGCPIYPDNFKGFSAQLCGEYFYIAPNSYLVKYPTGRCMPVLKPAFELKYRKVNV